MDGGIWNMESKNQKNREVLMGPFFLDAKKEWGGGVDGGA